MFGSPLLDISIGLIFVYLLLSLICSALNEIIEANLKNRASDLERGLRELLHDTSGKGLVKRLYDHPLIYGLFQGSYDPSLISKGRYSLRNSLPSYIPARSFALALMDIVLPAQKSSDQQNNFPQVSGDQSPLSAETITNPLQALRKAVNSIKNPPVEQALSVLIDAAGNDVNMVRENIETWYNSSMERVVGWYKRRAQLIIFFLGIAVTIALNADTIGISTSLSYDKAMRDTIVASAQEYAKQPTPDKPADRIKQNMEVMREAALPLGWNKSNPLSIPTSPTGWLLKILGWLITAVAISLGAPFWFDLLKKFMVVRTSINPIEKKSLGETGDPR